MCIDPIETGTSVTGLGSKSERPRPMCCSSCSLKSTAEGCRLRIGERDLPDEYGEKQREKRFEPRRELVGELAADREGVVTIDEVEGDGVWWWWWWWCLNADRRDQRMSDMGEDVLRGVCGVDVRATL